MVRIDEIVSHSLHAGDTMVPGLLTPAGFDGGIEEPMSAAHKDLRKSGRLWQGMVRNLRCAAATCASPVNNGSTCQSFAPVWSLWVRTQ